MVSLLVEDQIRLNYFNRSGVSVIIFIFTDKVPKFRREEFKMTRNLSCPRRLIFTSTVSELGTLRSSIINSRFRVFRHDDCSRDLLSVHPSSAW